MGQNIIMNKTFPHYPVASDIKDTNGKPAEAWRIPYRPKPLDECDTYLMVKERKFYLYLKYKIAHVKGEPRDLDAYIEFLQKDKRYNSQLKDYRTKRRDEIMKWKITNTEKNELVSEINLKPDELLSQDAASEFRDVVETLMSAYEELDEMIQDEDNIICEDDFNYKGYSYLYRYSSYRNLFFKFKPEFNEASKFLTILEGLNDSELKTLHNPFVQKHILDKIFVHPLTYIPYDYTLSGKNSANLTNNRDRIVNRFEKSHAIMIELNNNNNSFEHLPYDKALANRATGLSDGDDMIYMVRMYKWANRFVDVALNYPKRQSYAGLSEFIGYKTSKSLSQMREKMEGDLKDYEEELGILDAKPDDFPNKDILKEHYNLMYNSTIGYLQAVDFINLGTEKSCVEILQNPSAGNSSGAYQVLRYLEQGTWNEVKEEAQPTSIVVTFGDTSEYEK